MHGTSAHPFHSDQKVFRMPRFSLPACAGSVRRRRGRHRRRRADRRGQRPRRRPPPRAARSASSRPHRSRQVTQAPIDVDWDLEYYTDRVDQRCRRAPQPTRQHLVRSHPLRGPRGLATGGNPVVLAKTVLDYRIPRRATDKAAGAGLPAVLTLLPDVSSRRPGAPNSHDDRAQAHADRSRRTATLGRHRKVAATSTARATSSPVPAERLPRPTPARSSWSRPAPAACRPPRPVPTRPPRRSRSGPSRPCPPRRARPRCCPCSARARRRTRSSPRPADVCRATDGDVALIDGGVCRVVVRSGGDVVRTDKVKVSVPAKPAPRSTRWTSAPPSTSRSTRLG